jgi:hypothetical protein
MKGPLDVWAGTPISVSDQGVWTIEDAPQALISANGVGGMSVWVGDFGLIGLQSEMGGGALADEVLFSEDGTTWNRWNPTEIDQEAGNLYLVGIGDDFIVLQQGWRDAAFLWVGTLP